MNKSDFVNYRKLKREVEQLREQLAMLEGTLYSPKGQRFTSTPTASLPQGNTMARAVERHLELQELYFERLAEEMAKLQEVERAISSLEDPAERVVMRARYVLGWNWRRIIATLGEEGYSERQVYRLHGYALLKLKES